SRVELCAGRRVREREGDAGAPVAGQLAGGDGVPLVARGVLVDEEEAVALAGCWYAGSRPAEHVEVARQVGVVLDPNLARQRTARKLAGVDDRGRRAAVDVVLQQVPVRQEAAPIDRGCERIDAGVIARCDEEQGETHVLVPGDV